MGSLPRLYWAELTGLDDGKGTGTFAGLTGDFWSNDSGRGPFNRGDVDE